MIKLNKTYNYDDSKKSVLIIHSVCDYDIEYIVNHYVNVIRNKGYNVVTLYDLSFIKADAYYNVNMNDVGNLDFIYDLYPGIIDTSEIDKVVFTGFIKDRVGGVYEDIVDHLSYILGNLAKVYVPTVLNYTSKECYGSLPIEIIPDEYKLEGMLSNSYECSFYNYTYYLYEMYNIPTLSKPYICYVSENNMLDKYLQDYLDKSDFINKKDCIFS